MNSEIKRNPFLTVGQLVARLLPWGSMYGGKQEGVVDWSEPPLWPPDVFAVVASLVDRTQAYAHNDVRGGRGLGPDHVKQTRRIGRKWGNDPQAPEVRRWLQREWKVIFSSAHEEIGKDDKLRPWERASLRLLAAADEASVGIGFGTPTLAAKSARAFAPEVENSTLCLRVNPAECVVQPKGRTPPVGCNLRSMSLHLALLPGWTAIRHFHLDPPSGGLIKTSAAIGILLVPFPYEVPTSEISGRKVADQHWGKLRLKFGWGESPSMEELGSFVKALIKESKAFGCPVDVLIFPELAMSISQLKFVWEEVARQAGVKMLVSGCHGTQSSPVNEAVGIVRGPTPDDDIQWSQRKHHRWRVEKFQVKNYGLELDPTVSWWEDIDVRNRVVTCVRFANGATVATLVCEDLARTEPVQPSLREMGPSWVIALLMDGPQYLRRWSAKCATIFADDPGSAVLTLTSVGFVRRYVEHNGQGETPEPLPIGIWQDPQTPATELCLAPHSHALFFQTETVEKEEVTLDGRSDGKTAELLKLRPASIRSIALKRPPMWVKSLF